MPEHYNTAPTASAGPEHRFFSFLHIVAAEGIPEGLLYRFPGQIVISSGRQHLQVAPGGDLVHIKWYCC